MTNKTLRLAALFTLVYWLGNAWGCSATQENENYRILEEDRKMFDTSPHPDKPGATQAPLEAAPIVETAGSLNGIERSHWTKVAVRPESGAIAYQPLYFNDLPQDQADATNDPLAGADNAGLDKTHTAAIVVQPLKFAWDFALLPYHLIVDPPARGEWRVPGKWRNDAPRAAEPVAAETPAAEPSAEPEPSK